MSSGSGCPVEDNIRLVRELLELNDVTGNGYTTGNKVMEACRELAPGDDDKIRYLVRAASEEDLLDEVGLVKVLKSLCFAQSSVGFGGKVGKVVDRLRAEQRDRWLENPHTTTRNEEPTMNGLYAAALQNAGGKLLREKLEPLIAALAPSMSRRDRKKAMKVMLADTTTLSIPPEEIRLILEHAPQPTQHQQPEVRPSLDAPRQQQGDHSGVPGSIKDHMMASTQLQGLLGENEELRACTKRLREQLEIVTQLKVRASQNQTGVEERCARLEGDLAASRAEVTELVNANSLLAENLERAQGEVVGLRRKVEETPKQVVGNKSLAEHHQALREEAAGAMQPHAYEPQVIYRLVTEYDALVVNYDKKLHETKSRLHQNLRRVQQAETEFIRLASSVTHPAAPTSLGPNTAALPVALEQLQDAMVLMSKIRSTSHSPIASPQSAAGGGGYSRLHSTTPNIRSSSPSSTSRPRRAAFDKL